MLFTVMSNDAHPTMQQVAGYCVKVATFTLRA